MTTLQFLWDVIREPLQSSGGAAGWVALVWLAASKWPKIKCRLFGWHTEDRTSHFACCGLSVLRQLR